MYSFLYTPALKLDSLVKNLDSISADMIVVDIEDSIHINSKDLAKKKVKSFDFKQLIEKGFKVGIRVNTLSSINGIEDILFLNQMYKQKEYFLEYIFIPKVNSCREVEIYRELLSSSKFSPKLISFIETTEAVKDIDNIASKSDAICFGQVDLVAELYSPNETYINYTRSQICIAAAKNNIMAIDTNSFEINDMELFRQQCRESKEYGFTGKAAIHPRHVDIINEVFSIKEDEVENYKSLITAYNNATDGFAIVNGQVIAPPFIAKAKKMLKFYDEIKG